MILDTYRHKGLRKKLVTSLRNKGILDTKTLEAIERIPRHFFIDSALHDHAYEDKAFPIGEGQTISQPYTVAVQTSLLRITPGDKVLEIGTGSGYQAAVLCFLHAEVYSIEYHKALHLRAVEVMKLLKYKPHLYHGDGSLGLPQEAPFDKIIATAACPDIENILLPQLKNNGIMVLPVGTGSVQNMIKYEKNSHGVVKKTNEGSFRFVPLLGAHGVAKYSQ